MDARWQIELFGGLRVRLPAAYGGQVRRFRTQQVASLLACLAHRRGRMVPREVLAELCWPEQPPKASRGSLRTALSSLRRQLEPPGVLAGTVVRADRTAAGLDASAVITRCAFCGVASIQTSRSPVARGRP